MPLQTHIRCYVNLMMIIEKMPISYKRLHPKGSNQDKK